MITIFYLFIFLVSCFFIYISGELVVRSLIRIARFLGLREFVVAFFVMAFAASISNLLVGASSILHGVPQLSFGDIVGGNVIDLTLAVALAILFTKGGLPAESRTVQKTSIFTIIIALLPLVLILDGKLGRGDGIILLLFFAIYVFWLFSKKERFKKIYDGKIPSLIKEFRSFIKDVGRLIVGVVLLVGAAEGIVLSSLFFAKTLNFPIVLIGILIVGLGNSLPEIYFSVVSAKKGDNWMILGNLMGAIVVPTTLVLGVVALISPIEILDFSAFAIARIFLLISAFFFLIFIRSDRKLTKKEAFILFAIYIAFILAEIIKKQAF
jgi:cation:H+ antiporter